MRWLVPAAVVVTGLGVSILYVPSWKGVGLILPPEAGVVFLLGGAIGLVVGVAGEWRSRSTPVTTGARHRVADAAALAGLALAFAALLAVGTAFFFEPILVSLQGPDPCGAAKGVRPPDTACVLAHPDYYQYDPAAGSISTRASQISQTVDSVAGPAGVPLALAAALISWLALDLGTGRRRLALSALTISAPIVVVQVFFFLALIFGGGD